MLSEHVWERSTSWRRRERENIFYSPESLTGTQQEAWCNESYNTFSHLRILLLSYFKYFPSLQIVYGGIDRRILLDPGGIISLIKIIIDKSEKWFIILLEISSKKNYHLASFQFSNKVLKLNKMSLSVSNFK